MNALMLGKFGLNFRGGIEQVSLRWFNLYLEHSEHFDEPIYLGNRANGDQESSKNEILKSVQFYLGTQPVSFGYIFYFLVNYFKFGIVHAHFPNAIAALLCCICRPGSTIYVHWHSDLLGKGGVFSFIYNALSYLACKRAKKIIVTSSEYAAFSPILKRFPQKLSICPLTTGAISPTDGLNESNLEEKTDAVSKVLAAGEPFLLSVGRLVGYKGWLELVNGFALVKTCCNLVIVGDGPLREDLEKEITALSLHSRVVILSNVNEVELDKLYRNASAMILNSVSRAEAFGVVLIEAAAHGKPILSSRLQGSGMMHVNKDGITGLLHDPFDNKELSANIERLLQNKPLREKLAKGSLERFTKHFSDSLLLGYFERTVLRVKDEGL